MILKSVLAIIPYNNIYPPTDGKMKRYFHIIHELSKYFRVTIVINQAKEEFIKAIDKYPELENVKVYSTKDIEVVQNYFKVLPEGVRRDLRYRMLTRQLVGEKDDNYLKYHDLLIDLLKHHYYHAIILGNKTNLNVVNIIRKYDKHVSIIYDACSLNVSNLNLTNKEEKSLHKKVNAILANSKNQLEELKRNNNNKIHGIFVPDAEEITGVEKNQGDWNIKVKGLINFIEENKKFLETLKLNFGYFWEGFTNTNNQFINRLSKRYKIEISEKPDFYIFTHPFYNGKNDYLNFKCHRIFFGYENVRANWSICDYVFDPDYYENNSRHKHYPLWSTFDLKSLTAPKDLNQFSKKKKFCCMLVSNPNATERIEFFHKLSEYKKVDSAGRYLNNIGHSVEDKMGFIKDYKFVLSFENSSHPGYTTEKLVQPMLANSIPIYWGNPVVGNDFNTKSFIYINNFKSFDEAIKYIIELDTNEEKYLEMAAQPWFNNNKFNQEYLEESVLDFFHFIRHDSKNKRPVAKAFSKKVWQFKFILKKNILLILNKLAFFNKGKNISSV